MDPKKRRNTPDWIQQARARGDSEVLRAAARASARKRAERKQQGSENLVPPETETPEPQEVEPNDLTSFTTEIPESAEEGFRWTEPPGRRVREARGIIRERNRNNDRPGLKDPDD